MVEDVERTGERFDTRHLQRFLWALRRLGRCTFVVADDAESRLDFLKLCDTVELVPVVKVEDLERIFITAHNRWTTKYSDIEQWKSGQTKNLVEGLVPVAGVDDHYARVWNNLEVQPDESDLITLTELVADRLLAIHGSSASGGHPAKREGKGRRAGRGGTWRPRVSASHARMDPISKGLHTRPFGLIH